MNVAKNGLNQIWKSFFYRFILILIAMQIVDNLIVYLSLQHLLDHPRIPQFRFLCSISQIIVFCGFIFYAKPSKEDLGISWSDLKKGTKALYLIGGGIILLLVGSSYFVMRDIKYFALITNFHFGIILPIAEELLFRGYGWAKFRSENKSSRVTLLLTTVLFTLYHFGYYNQIHYATQFHPNAPSVMHILAMKLRYVFVLGILMGAIRWKSKRVFGSIIIHSILNIVSK